MKTTNNGTRIISSAHRKAEIMANRFVAEDGFDRFEAVQILKRIGPALPKQSRWPHHLIRHVELLVSLTTAQDWYDGHPFVWLSQSEAGERLGITAGQVRRNEAAMMRLGALCYTDSGNYKRFGRRCPETGKILEAYGLNLAPLGQLLPFLRQMERGILSERRERQKLYRRCSALRRRIRGLLGTMEEDSPLAVAFDVLLEQAATPRCQSIAELTAWQDCLLDFLDDIDEAIIASQAQKTGISPSYMQGRACIDAWPALHECTPHIIPDQESDNKTTNTCSEAVDKSHQKSDSQPAANRGCIAGEGRRSQSPQSPKSCNQLDITKKVSVQLLANSLPDEMADQLPLSPSWADLAALAERCQEDMRLSPALVRKAKQQIGNEATSLALILTAIRYQKGDVHQPAGYVAGMLQKAVKGELNLAASAYGLMSG